MGLATERDMTLKVLIVDDEALARSRLRTLLGECSEPRADVVGEAANAVQAMELIQRTGCDLVMLDIHMPGVDGMTLASLKAIGSTCGDSRRSDAMWAASPRSRGHGSSLHRLLCRRPMRGDLISPQKGESARRLADLLLSRLVGWLRSSCRASMISLASRKHYAHGSALGQCRSSEEVRPPRQQRRCSSLLRWMQSKTWCT